MICRRLPSLISPAALKLKRAAAVQGTGTGTNTDTGDTFPLLFDSDVRFMQGIYQSVDGRFLQATFALV